MSEPTDDQNPPTFDDQRPAIAVLFSLVWGAPHLPVPYTSISSGGCIYLNVSSPAGFEAWRAVLRIDPQSVELSGHGDHAWLTARTAYSDVPLEICTGGVPLSVEQANTRQTAETAAVVLA